jgi:selenocysteine lyase/cysteine desulfurase
MTTTEARGQRPEARAGEEVPLALISHVRNQFPALDRIHNGQPVAYFDGPGGTQVPRRVVEAMSSYLYHHNANTHWNYPTSAETDQAISEARVAVADFINGSPSEVVFGNNMTTITFHVARALGRTWGLGDEVVVTELDHHASARHGAMLA